MSWLKWNDKPAKFDTFEEGPLKDGALKDAVLDIATGTSPAKAIVKAIGGNTMNITDILTSKTIWGLLVAAAAPLAAKHGIVFDPNGLTADVVSLVGVAFSIYGRLTAKKSLAMPA